MTWRDDAERLQQAWEDLKRAVWAERTHLLITFLLILVLVEGIVIAATLLY